MSPNTVVTMVYAGNCALQDSTMVNLCLRTSSRIGLSRKSVFHDWPYLLLVGPIEVLPTKKEFCELVIVAIEIRSRDS